MPVRRSAQKARERFL